MKTITPLMLGLALALAAAAEAQAHARLVSADPPINGVAKAPPQNLDLLFSEKISEKLSGAVVKDPSGKVIPAITMTEKAEKGLMVMMRQPLKPGVYSVSWHAVASDDGHRTEGTYTFKVN
jgi:hypothetical protein